jgi:hypothetical protein
METGQEFGYTLKNLEDAKETCLSMTNPDALCHGKMQNTLDSTQALYEKILDDYKNKYAMIPNRRIPILR